MDIREKIGSLFVVGFDGTTVPDSLAELIRDHHIGGVILFKRNIESKNQLVKLIGNIKALAKGREFIVSVDHEGGRVFRLPPPFTQWPPMAKVACAEEAYGIGQKMANELKEVGFNVNFAPVLDINTNIKNPVIGDRSFSHEPDVVASLGTALMRGLQDNGMIACGKHFPGHGDTSLDSHTDFPTLPHTLKRLEAIELVPFMVAIEAGVKSLMTAHVLYEGIDKDLPATLSPALIRDLLRFRMGFHGVIFTDDLQMAAISRRWGVSEACVMSLAAGCDICLICRDTAVEKSAIEHVIEAVKTGKLPESLIEAAFHRVSSLFGKY